MTEYDLLRALKGYLDDILKDLIMVARTDKSGKEKKERPPRVFIGSLPDKEAERREAPYILLKFLKSNDLEDESTASVRIIIVTYSESKEENYLQCLNTLTRIKYNLRQDRLIDRHFTLLMPLECIMYEDDLEVYQIGEIMTQWELPPVHRNINKYFHYMEEV